MLTHTFSATGVSPPWYGLRHGFDVVLSMTGTNSLTLEREIVKGTWVTFGSAITAAGTTRKDTDDYAAPVRFRANLGTKDSGSVTMYVIGDILADEVSSLEGAFSLLMESDDDILTENGEYLNLEAA